MGKTRGKRSGQKARKRGLQERGGAQEIAALEQVETGERRNTGGIEGIVLEGRQERGEQQKAAVGSTRGGVPSPILPRITGQGGDKKKARGKHRCKASRGSRGSSSSSSSRRRSSQGAKRAKQAKQAKGNKGIKGIKGIMMRCVRCV